MNSCERPLPVPAIDGQSSAEVPPTVLATGVAGYIGSHFALGCLDAGWRVIGIDNLSVGHRSAVPSGVVFHEVDCRDPVVAEIARSEGATVAVHFAGLVSVAESMERPHAYFEANLANAYRFFTHVAGAGIRGAILSSTAAVYGGGSLVPVTEHSPLAPASPYGRSKLAAERMLLRLGARHGLSTVILRYFNVAGADPWLRAGPRSDSYHLIKIVSEAAMGRRSAVAINGLDYPTEDGTAVRDFIHVSDLADAHVAAIRYILQDNGRSTILNCGYGTGHSVRQVIEAARRQAPFGFDVTYAERRPGDVGSIVADATALRKTFDWQPRFDDLDTILRTAIQWERQSAARTMDGETVS